MRAKARSLLVLALPLLVARVLADHEHPTVAADDLALLTHLLNGRSYFHVWVLLQSDTSIYLIAQPQACLFALTRYRVSPLPHPNVPLLEAIRDPAPAQVVGRQLDDDLVARQDADVVHTHLARDVSEHLVPVIEVYPKHRI